MSGMFRDLQRTSPGTLNAIVFPVPVPASNRPKLAPSRRDCGFDFAAASVFATVAINWFWASRETKPGREALTAPNSWRIARWSFSVIID